MDTIPNTVRV